MCARAVGGGGGAAAQITASTGRRGASKGATGDAAGGGGGQVGTRGGGNPSVLDANYPPQLIVGRRPLGGGRGGIGGGVQGGAIGGGSRRGLGGGLREGRLGGGGSGGAIWGVGGGGAKAPLTSPCPPSNHTITINLSLTFAATWFGHASHVDWAEQDPPQFRSWLLLPHHCSPFWTPTLTLTLA